MHRWHLVAIFFMVFVVCFLPTKRAFSMACFFCSIEENVKKILHSLIRKFAVPCEGISYLWFWKFFFLSQSLFPDFAKNLFTIFFPQFILIFFHFIIKRVKKDERKTTVLFWVCGEFYYFFFWFIRAQNGVQRFCKLIYLYSSFPTSFTSCNDAHHALAKSVMTMKNYHRRRKPWRHFSSGRSIS